MKNKLFIPLMLAAFYLSCGDAQHKAESTEEEAVTSAESTEEKTFDMGTESSFKFDLLIANNIASPVKLLTDMNNAGLDNYQDDIANPTDKISNYVTSDEKALNFGIYGADLSYISLHNQHQAMADYLIAIRTLADELGLTNLFDQAAFERFENIKSNPDSVKMFIFEKYDEADAYLRSNERLMTATLILTGGLIESLHLASEQIEQGEANKEAYMIFLGQRNTLESLLDLFNTMETEGQDVPIRDDIELLYNKFVELDSMEKFSKENIDELHVIIDQVRDKLV